MTRDVPDAANSCRELAAVPRYKQATIRTLIAGASPMFREPVASSMIAAIGYDEDSETLEVEFVSGAVYRYLGVSQDVNEAFRRCASKGTFFNERIRDAYRWENVER